MRQERGVGAAKAANRLAGCSMTVGPLPAHRSPRRSHKADSGPLQVLSSLWSGEFAMSVEPVIDGYGTAIAPQGGTTRSSGEKGPSSESNSVPGCQTKWEQLVDVQGERSP